MPSIELRQQLEQLRAIEYQIAPVDCGDDINFIRL